GGRGANRRGRRARSGPQRRARRRADRAQDSRRMGQGRRRQRRRAEMNSEIVYRIRSWFVRSVREPLLDPYLLGALVLLAVCGLVTLYSASNLDRHLVAGQAARFVFGGLLM